MGSGVRSRGLAAAAALALGALALSACGSGSPGPTHLPRGVADDDQAMIDALGACAVRQNEDYTVHRGDNAFTLRPRDDQSELALACLIDRLGIPSDAAAAMRGTASAAGHAHWRTILSAEWTSGAHPMITISLDGAA